ncbi:MAG: transcription termination/antitermination protein NusA [Deltaproteobacteria bacterium]|nr:transcription termination/antitermination protein NusA [Deltaproteobacteria bacterium]
MVGDLRRLIDQVSRDKGIDKDLLLNTIMDAVRSAAKKKYGAKQDNIEVSLAEDTGEIEVFQFKEVVEEVTDPYRHITLEEARKLDPDSELGDSLGIKLDASSFGRIAAQSAKQVIIQGMRDAERDLVFEDYKDREGEIINGIVQRQDKTGIIVNLGRTEALVPYGEQAPREIYRQGDRIRAYVLEVKRHAKGPQIILSRVAENFLTALFEAEVPEIQEGIVSIMAVAREPGSRAKIAVASKDSDVDPVGACVGMKGSRVQNIVQELRGEKIDIVPWNPDPAKFVTQALAPAEVSRIIIDEDNQSMEIIVPDDQLSLAIGKRGQNVRLAARLTGWKIDVKSESKYSKSMKEGYLSLLKIPGVGEMTASALYEAGFTSARDVAGATVADLLNISGLTEKKALQILASAQGVLGSGEENIASPPVAEPESQEAGEAVLDADQA